MRIYIAGPMSGLPEFNYPAFAAAAAALRMAGYEVASPHEVDVSDVSEADRTWTLYMRRCIPMLLSCDAVALLPGWIRSRGAMLEFRIAVALGMECRSVEKWTAEEVAA